MTFALISAARVCANPFAYLSRRRLTIIVFAFAGGVLTITLLASTNTISFALSIGLLANPAKSQAVLIDSRYRTSPQVQPRKSEVAILQVFSGACTQKQSRQALLGTVHLPREEALEEKIALINLRLEFLETLYRTRQEDLQTLQKRGLNTSKGSNISHHLVYRGNDRSFTMNMHSAEAIAIYKNMTGMKAAEGLRSENLKKLRMPFAQHIWPHLMDDPHCLKPAYHMSGGRDFVNVVIGIPTVKRDKESYLMLTLQYLVEGLTHEDKNDTLIVVFVGETDLEYVMNIARKIEIKFPMDVKKGLIEVISPSQSYYPDLSKHLQPNLGDSLKRVKWRTKQNLDTIYLMAYSQPKAPFYLMLEDDVVARSNFMQEIKSYIGSTSVKYPYWIFIEFCATGGIGKLIRSSHLAHFITYLQLFYSKMPIDWLLEFYLRDQVCPIDASAKRCTTLKLDVRPKYKSSLFQHIGLYSSLKGKLHKIKDSEFNHADTFYSHKNPLAKNVTTDMNHHGVHDLKSAYDGVTYFWGIQPKAGNVAEIWFEIPVHLESYFIRSGNVQHANDKFNDCLVQVQLANKTFIDVGWFDEFGLAEGDLHDLGPLNALRIKVTKDSTYWVIISEIYLKPYEEMR